MESSFEKRLFPYKEIPLVFPHPSAFSSGEKDAGHLDVHDVYSCIRMLVAKKKEGVGHPTPS